MDDQIAQSALAYHRFPTPGKISVVPTKGMTNQHDLALAYSPGVAAACMAIVEDPDEARSLTSRGNLVAVITNGTAVLGLGNIGPLAGKPVMEGKACLFKKFAGIDVFDIELDETDPDKLVDIIAAMEPTFGGINLEDIKAPECFIIERKLRERMKIPVFHDDQHGTAIVVGAAVFNAMELVGKKLGDVKLVCSGAGAAALACLDLLVELGVRRENIFVSDLYGVVHLGRAEAMDENKSRYAQDIPARTLGDIIAGADIFLGLSAGGVLKPDMVKQMGPRPLILAMANPEPEILPEDARAVRPDAIIATGRSDYPNQVNNVLCFPFIFRGALDVGATTINEAMKLAAVHAIASLAHAEQSDVVTAAYGHQESRFGEDYLIPKPFDPRLICAVAPAVAEAAMASGVATRPLADIAAYRRDMEAFVYRSGNIMKPVFEAAGLATKKILYAEGEDMRVLRAAQIVVDEKLARPVLVGRRSEIEGLIASQSLRLRIGQDVDVVDIADDHLINRAAEEYYSQNRRNGASLPGAVTLMRSNPTLLAAMILRWGEADGMLCGTYGAYSSHLVHVANVIGRRAGAETFAAMNLLMLPQHTLFITDTYINSDPTAEQLAQIARLAAEEVARFGLTPRVAFVSHSSFGSADTPSARKMREALSMITKAAPDLECEGEMHGDAALSKRILDRIFPGARLGAEANLLVMPNLDAANITFNVLKIVAGEGVTVGPILLGAAKAVHILTPTSSVRRIVNMTALTAVDAAIQP
ncbi:MAG: NADP-dependent malic enzyme [Beijerinckiaceae bacterium]|nr:NADP-dependent malic enzyme [Beijerinckiaceae bacterium]MDO9442338.1 NADP-dependent malic enzyme [Beijerinckiaceae bacterium]